jgi:hypothetical protein
MKAHERAAQIWPTLALAARNRQVLTYGMLAKLISVPTVGLGQLLEPIQSHCLLSGVPPLSAIVVSAETGLPGTGFIAAEDVPREQMRVFAFDWLAFGCPTSDTLATSVTRLPSNGIAAAKAPPSTPASL